MGDEYDENVLRVIIVEIGQKCSCSRTCIRIRIFLISLAKSCSFFIDCDNFNDYLVKGLIKNVEPVEYFLICLLEFHFWR